MAAHNENEADPSSGLLSWLRATLATYVLEPVAIYRPGTAPQFPLTADNETELQAKLETGGHFLPLPKEPAALANILEVAIVDFLVREIAATDKATITRGTERGYPDIEIGGDAFGGGFHAIDVKVARRGKSLNQTESRITLYTGNTYFRYPQLKWPGTFRPFQDYASHLDVIVIYTLNESSHGRIDDLEVIVHEPWRIASKQRSSTTREYLGAVKGLQDLRDGKGEFATDAEFYTFWRKYPFKIGRVVQQQLDKMLRAAASKP
ncbi:restriction endonuclease [Bradyrhizobium pachyrhizi]|uniref:type II restriction endonuclease n=1 Tax=Bradyrhizobium pachyrhizi TaxID=280333 RepID=UPI0007054786|nr:type II restriction endonuclease [Bradyrhizobium pachyrhizi]KRQ01365.1 restriction endonuclease [Bradyrhizobium pachyrhizi]